MADDDALEKPLECNPIVRAVLARILGAKEKQDLVWSEQQQKKKQIPGKPPLLMNVAVNRKELMTICKLARDSFAAQDTIINISKDKIYLVGDLHGQLYHLLRIIRTLGYPRTHRYLFLGDYVDRGTQGIELVIFLFCLKIRYPQHVFMLRGNHEDVNTTLTYGFYDEIAARFNPPDEIYGAFIQAFNNIPFAAVVGEKIFACHGGISPFCTKIADMKNEIKKGKIVPPSGVACDLVWGDPSEEVNQWTLSHRGISFLFGKTQVENFCRENKLDLIVRGHQLNTEMYKTGYRLLLDNHVVSIFTAPNYMNYRNAGAVVAVDQNLMMTFHVFTYDKEQLPTANNSKRLAKNRKKKSSENSFSLEQDIDTEVESTPSRESIEVETKSAILKPTNDVQPQGQPNKKQEDA